MTDKSELRKQLDQTRRSLSREQVGQASLLIFEHWRQHFMPAQLSHVHLFQSMLDRNEIDTAPFVDFVRSSLPGTQLVIPRVHGDELLHALFTPELRLEPTSWGVPEPVGDFQEVMPEAIDMVLVPMLGFDRHKHRLGYGRGYYDRFLSRTRRDCLKVGLCLELCRCEKALPSTESDVALDWIITEKGVY